MICSKCKNDGVLVELMSVKYYYCRTCKDEIKLEAVETPVGNEDLVAEFERLVAEGGKDANTYHPPHGGYPGGPLDFDPSYYDYDFDDEGDLQ
jgi:hypothetical protein